MMQAFDPVTAYHEAGHAVMALVLDRPVSRVSVRPGHETDGICHFGKSIYRPSEDWVEREILIALGGIAAEARFTGNYDWDAAGKDQRYVARLAADRAGERRAERLQRRLLSRAEHIIGQEENWQAVQLIASELLQHGEISGRTVKHLYERCRRK